MKSPSLPRLAIVLVSLLSLLGGCGYQLRGAVDLPPQMARIYIDSDARNPMFLLELRTALKVAGAEVLDSPGKDSTTLHLRSIDEQRVTSGRDANRNAAQYRVGLSVEYETHSADGSGIAPTTALAVQQFDYNPALPVEMERQERTIFEHMTRNVVQQIVRRLSHG